jgi:nucleotide-binding universal stress UspA family protein
MRILIAHNGEECSDLALEDLVSAGLPKSAIALVFSVAETPLGDPQVEVYLMNERMRELREAAQTAAARLRATFSGWRVDAEVWPGVACTAIAERAQSFNADLVVVGSHHRSRLGRLVMGSVSQGVLHRATCSVRIGHRPMRRRDEGLRLLIGIDGSRDADAVIHAVANRYWPTDTEARVVRVIDSADPLAVGRARPALAAVAAHGGEADAVSPFEREYADASPGAAQAVKDAAAALRAVGLRASPQVLEGDPADTLLAEADRCGADCIFVGARGLGRLERLIMGSVSSAVAARSDCSVEVVRTSSILAGYGW